MIVDYRFQGQGDLLHSILILVSTYISAHLKTKCPDIQVGMVHISSKAFKRALGSSCTENFCLKFMHDVLQPCIRTWPGCYDGSLLVVNTDLH